MLHVTIYNVHMQRQLFRKTKDEAPVATMKVKRMKTSMQATVIVSARLTLTYADFYTFYKNPWILSRLDTTHSHRLRVTP